MPGRQTAEADCDALELAYRLLNVHMHLLGVIDPHGIQSAGRDGNGLTEDALRPRSDAGRGDGADEKIATRPRVTSRGSDLGSSGECGCNRPEVHPQDGVALSLRRPTASSQDSVEAATQPHDGCVAAVKNRPGAGRTRPGCPDFRTGIGGAVLDPSSGSRSGWALIPRGTPSGEQGSIRQAAPGRGWTLQVSRHETLEKARN